MRTNYSSEDLEKHLVNSGVSLTGKKYSQHYVALGAFDLIYSKFIQHLIDSSIAGYHMELPGRLSSLWNHVFIVGGRLVHIEPFYGHLDHRDDEEVRRVIGGISLNGYEESVREVVSRLEAYAASLQNLSDSAEEHLSKQNIKSTLRDGS